MVSTLERSRLQKSVLQLLSITIVITLCLLKRIQNGVVSAVMISEKMEDLIIQMVGTFGMSDKRMYTLEVLMSWLDTI